MNTEARNEQSLLAPGQGESKPAQSTIPAQVETDGKTNIPGALSILPMRNIVLFPGTVAPLSVGRPSSLKLLEETLPKGKIIGVVGQRDQEKEDPSAEDLYPVGAAAMVLKLVRQDQNKMLVVVQALSRFRIKNMVQTQPYFRADVEELHDIFAMPDEKEWAAELKNLRDSTRSLIELTPDLPEELGAIVMNIETPGQLADFVASNLAMPLPDRQALLEELDVVKRVRAVQQRVFAQLEIARIQQRLQQNVNSQLTDMQRRAYLREQIKAIQRELGEGEEGTQQQTDALRQRLVDAKAPPEVMEQAERELKRLNYISPAAAEYSVIASYVETLADLPWARMTEDNLDLKRAQEILDRDHFGLEKVKRRLIEYLAVRKLNPEGRGPILCFLGPPGVGKTSLGQSIADALGRKFTRISLGGMRDEAEIRGHRRTYIGSMPGRLIQELRKLGTRNPVLMLDEIDKLGMDFRGDPASALLEVLDPRQNQAFVDHYLDVPFDLSQVIFIATANYMDPVPPALRDRMEVIEIPGYTDHEKLQIAKNYLVKRQLKENGLTPEQCAWPDDAIARVIENYTREAGVRELERQIGSVCRSVAATIARGDKKAMAVTPQVVEDVLGPPRFVRESRSRKDLPGVVNGLAYTPVGGEVLTVEATRFPGKGHVTLTGQIGNVMKESVQAALSLVRSRVKELGINPDSFKSNDIHVHVPSGAVPKDGPSAGVAMFTALASLFTDTPVRATVAMTGEITLRGLVLPIGGLKEKSLAAMRSGIDQVIIPKANEKDLPDVPGEVKKKIQFIPVETVDEVLKAALVAVAPPKPAPSKTPKRK
jgi:ATP-dependent Lon protease